MIKDKLQIVLITYNRKKYLEETLNKILSNESPIKDFDITILDNASTDGSSEIIEEFCQKFPNLKHVRHCINIGGCPNIARAFSDYLDKEYIWLLSDNDDYCWKSWNEVEYAIKQNFDVVMTLNCKNTPSDIIYSASLISGAIYKTSIFTNTIIENLYYEIANMYPHLALIIKNINDNNKIFIIENDIVRIGINPGYNTSLVRELNISELSENRKNIFVPVAYFSALELVTNKKLRAEIIENTRHFHKSLYDLFKTIMIINKVFYNNYFNNLYKIFRMLNFSQRLRFIFAYLVINLSFKNYRFYEIRSIEDWTEYFQRVNEQKYIDELSKTFKNKKIVLYGAGLVAKILTQNYDLSNFDIVGIADKRFETSEEKEVLGYKAIKPSELNSVDCDVILFTMKLYKNIEKVLKQKGINKKCLTLVKTSNKYAMRV